MWTLAVIVVILDIILYFSYSKLRGMFGEHCLKKELKKLPKEYIILNNIMIKDEWGTHQIDHIVISKYGIFIIETKFYYGYITGNEYSEQWLRKRGKSKIYFHNPIHQNYGHIKALANILNLNEDCFVSIVCFSHTTKLNIKAKKAIITKVSYINDNIKKHQNVILDDIATIKNIILTNNITNVRERKKHIKTIESNLKQTNVSIKENICPKCGNRLVKKHGKNGYFLGCTNYPKCRFIKKL